MKLCTAWSRFAARVALVVVAGVWCGRAARAENVVNPAERPGAESTAPSPARLPSYEMPPVTVEGVKPSSLREEDRIGDNLQPRWTATRRFGETRVYVRPPGDFEFEYWMIGYSPRHNGTHHIENQYEVEMGLPYRFQIDLYLVSEQNGTSGSWQLTQQKLEGRWALADWGKIWGNPTLYLEWTAMNLEPDHLEGKLLLGDEIAPRWHWGANFVCENQMGWHHEDSYEFTGGVSYTVVDEKFSVGGEWKFAYVDDNTDRGHYTSDESLLGPSIQLRPLPQMHINVAGLLGTSKNSPELKVLMVMGWEFA
ncbi:MAG: hypothetical protein ACREJ2_12950 [Planctomycetota bacterium]